VKELPPDFHHATLTADTKTMYLQGPLEKDRVGLFRSNFDGKAWGKPEELTELNHAEAKSGDRSPTLTRDGFDVVLSRRIGPTAKAAWTCGWFRPLNLNGSNKNSGQDNKLFSVLDGSLRGRH
jgi:hypothetical protein